MPRLGFGVFQNYTTKDSVLEALKAGYRHIDTAQMYRNEAHVGAAFHESAIPRSEVFITTKCNIREHGYESTLRGVDASLQTLQLDYVDLFLIHAPFPSKELRLATYKALQEAKAAGKIRSVGVSNFGIKHLEEIESSGYEMPSVNQIELHPFCQQRPIVAYCQNHSIVVQAYCPIIRGKMDHEVIQECAKKHGRDPAQILLRWSLQKGFVPLPKSATPSRIWSNCNLYDFELDDDDMQRLDALDQGDNGSISWNPIYAA